MQQHHLIPWCQASVEREKCSSEDDSAIRSQLEVEKYPLLLQVPTRLPICLQERLNQMRQMRRLNLQDQQRKVTAQIRERANRQKLPRKALTESDPANQEHDQELLQLTKTDRQDDLLQDLQDRNQRQAHQALELRLILNNGPPLT